MRARFLGLALVLSASVLVAQQPPTIHIEVNKRSDAGLIQRSDLVYRGTFALPDGQVGASDFLYGGPIAYYPQRDSLYVFGNQTYQMLAEVNIPTPTTETTLFAYQRATVLQPFVDPFEGHRTDVSSSGGAILAGGLLPVDGQLYITAFDSYDADQSQRTSHFVRSLDLSTKSMRGPFQIGSNGNAGWVSGYFTLVPAEWQAVVKGKVLGGQCCLSIIGRTSAGPSISLITLSALGPTPAPTTHLLAYGLNTPLHPFDGTSNTLFNTTTRVLGAVWPTGSRSVLFFGRHGRGAYCYGEWMDCNDPADTAKGPHQPPYYTQVWAYDANDLLAVESGQRQEWDVRPYNEKDMWTVYLPWNAANAEISGVAYDQAHGRVFISATGLNAEGRRQLVHVFTLPTQ